MATLPPEIRALVIDENNSLSVGAEQQISPEVVDLLIRIKRNEAPTEAEMHMLINPAEAAAILSVRSNRHVSHRYVKERARTKGKEGKELHPKLLPAKVAGKTNLYRLDHIWSLGEIRPKKSA